MSSTTPDELGTSSRPKSIALGESTFNALALDVSNVSKRSDRQSFKRNCSDEQDKKPSHEVWEDVGVVEYLERGHHSPDASTCEEREESLREVLADADIHEGSGDLSDFLFHVARTKHGKIYIRVIRTLLLNRGMYAVKISFDRNWWGCDIMVIRLCIRARRNCRPTCWFHNMRQNSSC